MQRDTVNIKQENVKVYMEGSQQKQKNMVKMKHIY